MRCTPRNPGFRQKISHTTSSVLPISKPLVQSGYCGKDGNASIAPAPRSSSDFNNLQTGMRYCRAQTLKALFRRRPHLTLISSRCGTTSTLIDWASRVNPGDQVNPTERGKAGPHKILDRARVSFDPSREGFEELDVMQDIDEVLTNITRDFCQSKSTFSAFRGPMGLTI